MSAAISALLVCFTVEHESHELQTFQSEGHFVSGLKDVHGFSRQWKTNEVHILTLRYPRESPLYKNQQILRVMADTEEAARTSMCRTIEETFFALWAASQASQSTHQEWMALNEKRNQFQMFLNSHYAREIETGQHLNLPTVFDVAVHYMRKERNRLAKRIGRWLRREKPAVQSEWIPQEWKR